MTNINQLLKDFERFAYGQSLSSAFTELLDWTLLSFKWFESGDEQRAAFETFRMHKKVDQLTSLIAAIGDLSEHYCDPLGELFMQAISSGHNGQFFTPEPLCDMMTTMTIGENSKPNQTICDPACGSGRMLLSAAKINRDARFYGADLDITCCKMALINMLFNSLHGEIAHMNTLSNLFFTGYKVCTTLIDTHHVPYYIEFTDPEQSYICLHDLKANNSKSAFDTPFQPVRSAQPFNGVQGSLF